MAIGQGWGVAVGEGRCGMAVTHWRGVAVRQSGLRDGKMIDIVLWRATVDKTVNKIVLRPAVDVVIEMR